MGSDFTVGTDAYIESPVRSPIRIRHYQQALAMERWNRKVAVITGAGSGIGAVIATTLTKKGMIVVGLDIDGQKLKKVASKVNITCIKCDIRVESQVVDAFNKIEKQYGGVDLLINSAAVVTVSGFLDGSFENWKSIIDTNIIGMSLCCREALKTMRSRSEHAHIINLNSITGHVVLKLYNGPLGMYPTSKHGVTGLTQTLRLELRSAGLNIKVTSLTPGLVLTDMGKYIAKTTGKPFDENSDELPIWALDCQDVADAVVGILSLNPRVEIQELTMQRTTSSL